jgi:plastocyanin
MEIRRKQARLGMRGIAVIAASLAFPALAAAQDGTITGKISLEGTPPAAAKLKMDADPVCAEAHASAPAMAEEIVAGSGGTLQNVFVYVKEGLGDKKFPAPTEPVTMDQRGCQYHPHIFGVQVGQPLKILNSDQTLHNVHGMPKNNPQWNFAMPKFVKQKETKDLTKPEIMVHVKCDVHPWMSGYVGVLPHPFFAVSGKDGTYTIEGLPPGEYTIEAWQEKLGAQTAKVKVDGSGTATSDFTFKAS